MLKVQFVKVNGVYRVTHPTTGVVFEFRKYVNALMFCLNWLCQA